jgi:hypothetical protein
MGATSETGTVYLSRVPEITPSLWSGACVGQSLVFCVRLFAFLSYSLLVLFRFISSDYPFDIFKRF